MNKKMEKHDYRGYEITIETTFLQDGRVCTDTQVKPISDKEKARIGHSYLIGSKQVHLIPESRAVVNALQSAKHSVDRIVDVPITAIPHRIIRRCAEWPSQ
jgi:hypothetical protein